eukprot:UN11044
MEFLHMECSWVFCCSWVFAVRGCFAVRTIINNQYGILCIFFEFSYYYCLISCFYCCF